MYAENLIGNLYNLHQRLCRGEYVAQPVKRVWIDKSDGRKMNDLIISERQKHNGMSWSKDGSLSLAELTSLIKNNESHRWFADGYLEFKLAA